MDSLEQVLRLMKIKPHIYFSHKFSPPWGMEIEAGPFAQFHIVVHGACLLQLAAMEQKLTLSTGDIILLPRGTAHSLLSGPEAEAVSGSDVITAHAAGRPMFCGDRASAELVCGHFEYDHDSSWQPLIEVLPDLIHIPAQSYGVATEATTVALLLTKEMGKGFGGDGLVAARLAEALFIMTLRAYSSQKVSDRGFLAAIEDPRVGRALALIHGENGHRHSLEELVGAAGMSRSTFAQRFKELIGLSPVAYADGWRLLRAREILQDRSLSVAEVASRVGYESEAAFHRAFKREFSITPAQIRR